MFPIRFFFKKCVNIVSPAKIICIFTSVTQTEAKYVMSYLLFALLFTELVGVL